MLFTALGDLSVIADDGTATRIRAGRQRAVLAMLMLAANTVVSRAELIDGVWGKDAFTSARIVDNHIANLRKKIEPDPAHPQYLKNVRGLGYRFDG